jgi:amino acid transporter
VPFVVADDGYLPSMLARTDGNGTPRNAVIISAIVYSVFVLIPFGSLVVADVLLYSLALSLELASLVRLRRREPELRGAFRIPLGVNGVTVLAAMPVLVLLLVIVLSFSDGEFGVPALIGTVVAIALGPIVFAVAVRKKSQRPTTSAASAGG